MVTHEAAYAILGLEAGASSDAVKKAFRRLAKVLHPDHASDEYAPDFRRLKEAHDVALRPEPRAQARPRAQPRRYRRARWFISRKGNWCWKTPSGAFLTVFMGRDGYTYVCDGEFCQDAFDSAEEAKSAAEEEYGGR